MFATLKFILASQLKRSQSARKMSGFTLIELLVAIIIAALVITPLLGFAIDILQTDRREQAKATTEQELQAALDYIARDLQQAVYIYDEQGLTEINNTGPNAATRSGIRNQIPPIAGTTRCDNSTATCQPILVFWKRQHLDRQQVQNLNIASLRRNDGTYDDAFIYSLVGYYLIEDNNGLWSDETARIGRFEIRDGIRNPNATATRTEGTTTVNYDLLPSQGFSNFDLSVSGSNLGEKLNQWTKHPDSYDTNVNILVDYIDQNAPTPTCPVGMSPTQPTSTLEGGFYACVNTPDNTIAQVYLRGNALARIQQDTDNVDRDEASTYFPTATMQIQRKGFLNID